MSIRSTVRFQAQVLCCRTRAHVAPLGRQSPAREVVLAAFKPGQQPSLWRGYANKSQAEKITNDAQQDIEAEGVSKEPKGPNMDQMPHVSEEAAAMGEILGGGQPDLEQGTPVSEVRHQPRCEGAFSDET